MGNLSNKVALVTGGATGIGKIISTRLLDDRATVIVTDVDVETGSKAAREIGALFLEQDVCDEARWTEVMRSVEDNHGRLDILVNNAGISGPMDATDPEKTRLTDWRKVFAVNLDGVFLGCRSAITSMRRTGSAGSIINISSVAGLLATPYATAYGASKAAVRQLTKSIAQHCAEQKLNIRCNSVHPGVVRTALWDAHAREIARSGGISVDEVVAREKALCPMGDFVQPEDVAAAVSFFASADSRYITGGKLIVDGGFVDCDTFGR
jgi:3(or 17)beta-hydroxysteroid dehydrogenase